MKVQVKTVCVEYERKFNLADYESQNLKAVAWADIVPDPGETITIEMVAAAHKELWEEVKETVKDQAMPVLVKRNADRAAKSAQAQRSLESAVNHKED